MLINVHFILISIHSVRLVKSQNPPIIPDIGGQNKSLYAATSLGLERSLITTKVLTGYERGLSPPGNGTIVLLNPALYQLVNLDAANEVISFFLAMRMIWQDPRLVFDFSNYTDQLYLPVGAVWKPDIVLANMVYMFYPAKNVPPMYVRITSAGIVHWEYPAVVTISCTMDVANFPFDRQICQIPIYSWTMNTAVIDLKTALPYFDLSYFADDNQWKLIETTANVSHVTYACCVDPYAVATYTVTYERRALYYVISIILPSCILMMVAIIGLFTPSSSELCREEKVSFGVAVLLTLAVLLLMVSDSVPKTSNSVPALSMFFLTQIILTAVATITATVIMWVNRLALKKVIPPGWLFSVLFLTPMNRKAREEAEPEGEYPMSEDDLFPKSFVKHCKQLLSNKSDKFTQVNGTTPDRPHTSGENPHESVTVMLTYAAWKLDKIRSSLTEETEDSEMEVLNLHWSRIASRMDLLAMIIFYFILFGSIFFNLVPWYTPYMTTL